MAPQPQELDASVVKAKAGWALFTVSNMDTQFHAVPNVYHHSCRLEHILLVSQSGPSLPLEPTLK